MEESPLCNAASSDVAAGGKAKTRVFTVAVQIRDGDSHPCFKSNDSASCAPLYGCESFATSSSGSFQTSYSRVALFQRPADG